MTLGGCFHIHLLKKESFSELNTWTYEQRDITATYTSVMWKLDISGICISIDSGFFNEGEGVDVILYIYIYIYIYIKRGNFCMS